MTNIILNYAGLLLGILSILATIYFAIKYAERKEPRFYSINERKIAVSEDAPEDIQITYKGQRVTRVSSTLIWFWNAGKRPIKKEDVPTGQPLLVKLSETNGDIEILDVTIRKSSREAINFGVVKHNSSTVKLDFDFLDNNDGAAVEIQHTGTRSTTVTISGVILGASKGVRMVSRRSLLTSRLLPLRHYHIRRSHSSKIPKIAATVIFIAIFGGLSLFLLRFGEGEITTSRELLHTALESYLTSDSVDSVIQAVESSAKYQTLNKVMPYFFSGFLILNLLMGLIFLWRSPVAFPNVLLIDDFTKKDEHIDEKIIQSNQSIKPDA